MTTLGELCSGYGGLGLAVAAIKPDVRTAWWAETALFPAAVMAAHHPDAPNLGDITTVDWVDVEPVDVLTAGFPCQPVSVAGRRLGTADRRYLWDTGVVPAIEALQPESVIIENVPGLLTTGGGEIFHRILHDLYRLGYHTRWTVVGACAVGACHHRHRVFLHAARGHVDIIGPDSGFDPAKPGTCLASVEKWPHSGYAGMVMHQEPSHACGGRKLIRTVPTLPTPTARDAERGAGWGGQPGRPLSEVAVMLPTPTASDASRGPSDASRGSRRGGRTGRPLPEIAVMLPTPRASDGAKGGPNQRGSKGDWALPAAVQPERWGRYAEAVAAHETAFQELAPNPTAPGERGAERLSPRFAEWMMGLPAGWVTSIPWGRVPQLQALGNGVVPAQAASALRKLRYGAAPDGV